MPKSELSQSLSESQRQEIFLALVTAQDEGMSVPQSRQSIAEQFHLEEKDVRSIEQEGLECQWPPLN
jgi:hypothetical protein